MPSLTNGNGAAKTASGFQLPALDFKFGSLTDGTDIPPPLPSPTQEELSNKPAAAQPAADPVAHPATVTSATQTTPESQRNGLNRSTDQPPGSPTSSKAPASIRRLFSRNRLNEALYADGHPHLDETLLPRPISQSNASIATDKQSRRSSGWFRRLRGSDGGDSKRSSRIFFQADSAKPATAPASKPAGPPPPMIPEFKALGSKVDLSDDAGSLGADLFKDIK